MITPILRYLGQPLKFSQTAREGALLSEIDQSCKRCGKWGKCTKWLESDKQPEAYRSFCPNVTRWDELARN